MNSRSPSDKESSSSPANDAPVRLAPGGVGAVRRARAARHSRRLSGSFFVALIVLVAAGGLGAPVGFSPSPDTDVLSATRLEPAARAARSHSRMLSRLMQATEASNLQARSAAASAAAVPAPAEPTTAVDRPIVAPPSFTRPSKPAKPLKALQPAAGPKDGGVWALVVGIDDYPGNDADLSAGKADAREVDSALAAYGVPGARRVLLLDQQATADNIRSGLAWLAGRASSDATVVFFYSGHVRQVTGDADRDGEATDEAIVAADGDAVYDGEVAGIFRSLEARSAWIGIAGCYGSGFDDALASGRVLTAAAAETDLAYENSALGHSYLVEYMVHRAMLQGRASGSVQESFSWAQAQIAKDYPNRQPVMVDRARAPMVLGSRNQAAPPAQSAGEPPPPAPAEPQPGPSEQPATPPTTPSEPGGGPGACAEFLGVSVCSTGGSARPNPQTGWRRAV